MAIRCFLAFELPAAFKDLLSAAVRELKPFPLDVKWVKTENIHLTVVFLGQVDAGMLTAIGNEVGRVCREYGSFEISLKGMGTFGSKRNPRVLWVGINGDLKRMGDFRDHLQEVLVPMGIKTEKRAFKPHLTLGRFRKGARTDFRFTDILHQKETLSSPVCTLEKLCLFKSDLKPTGAVYTKLSAWPLNGSK